MPIEEVRVRVKRIASLLKAIEQGELLSALPTDPAARTNHQAAADLLALMGEELEGLLADLR